MGAPGGAVPVAGGGCPTKRLLEGLYIQYRDSCVGIIRNDDVSDPTGDAARLRVTTVGMVGAGVGTGGVAGGGAVANRGSGAMRPFTFKLSADCVV
jgi:hypothetical protein